MKKTIKLRVLFFKKHFDNPKILIIILLFGSLGFINCSKTKDKQQTPDKLIENKKYLPEKNEVDAIILKQEIFKKEIVSNGKLVALQKNQLKFDVSEKLEHLFVKNGEHVKKGQTLAILKAFTFHQAYTKAKIGLKKAELEFHDKLIGRGYETFNKDSIPPKEYEMLSIRSGYKDALHELQNADFNLKATKLIAPFDGIIATVKSKQYEIINSGTEVMTLINDNMFEVEFHLIESEVSEIVVNGTIQIEPFALKKTSQ